jgi:hypothetical protein
MLKTTNRERDSEFSLSALKNQQIILLQTLVIKGEAKDHLRTLNKRT